MRLAYLETTMKRPEMPQEFRDYLAETRRRAWKRVPKEERKAHASKAVQSYWDRMSPEEKSTEMKRRAAKREANRKKAAGAKKP
jgi:hypothetical protein